jgi:hypothetical protein
MAASTRFMERQGDRSSPIAVIELKAGGACGSIGYPFSCSKREMGPRTILPSSSRHVVVPRRCKPWHWRWRRFRAPDQRARQPRVEAAGAQASAHKVSVLDKPGLVALAGALDRAHGKIDILVNNAGFGQVVPLALMGEDDWDQMIDTHVKGAVRCQTADLDSIRWMADPVCRSAGRRPSRRSRARHRHRSCASCRR